MKLILTLFSLIFVAFLAGCSPDEGVGGISTINGKVMLSVVDNGVLVDSFGAQEERVYLVFGENQIFDKDTRTHFNGDYKFENLHPGSYSVYAYSECDTCKNSKEPIIVNVTIGKNEKTVQAPVINIEKQK